METEDKSESRSTSSVHMPTNQIDVEANVSSPISFPFGEEHAPKIRKPYTITKQRERWTEDEHKKFLEALQLYGRAWRRIEEHIGTKTAVQIRSHAQKFFTKVARESATNGEGTVKPIMIPPPRPKRKPSHPYPRKFGHSAIKEMPVLEQLKRPSLTKPLLSEQENRSPTSVLSSFGSETMNSLLSSLPNNCTSPIESASGSNGQKDGVEQENTSPFQALAKGGVATQEHSSMEHDLVPDKGNGSSIGTQASTLKLFGRTVTVTSDSHKPSSGGVEIDMVQCCKPLPPDVKQSLQRNLNMGLNSPFQPPINPWAGGAAPLYCLPFHKDLMNPSDTGFVSMPWWSFYGNMVLPYVDQQKEAAPGSCPNGLEMQKEGSRTGSNTASFSGGNGDQNGDIANSDKGEHATDELPVRLKTGGDSAFSTWKADPGRGFVPYKRCAAEEVANEEGESQNVRSC